MKKNTGVVRKEDNAPAVAVHPGFGRSGQELGMRDGMVEAVNGVSVCFTCQQVGHISRNCPTLRGQAMSDGVAEARARQEHNRRREEDRNEFLSAVSEVSSSAAAAAAAAGSAGVAGAAGVLQQAEARQKRLPAFLAVKRRRGEGADEAAGTSDTPAGKADPAGGAATAAAAGPPPSLGPGAGLAAAAAAAAAGRGGAAGPGAEGAALIGGLGTYDSSSEEDDEDEEEEEDGE